MTTEISVIEEQQQMSSKLINAVFYATSTGKRIDKNRKNKNRRKRNNLVSSVLIHEIQQSFSKSHLARW